jgi:hypothetical protein
MRILQKAEDGFRMISVISRHAMNRAASCLRKRDVCHGHPRSKSSSLMSRKLN